MLFCFYVYGHHRDLHVLTHSFPTRRSSDLLASLRLLPKLGIDDDHRALAVAGDRLRSFAARLVDDLAQLGLGLGDGPRVGGNFSVHNHNSIIYGYVSHYSHRVKRRYRFGRPLHASLSLAARSSDRKSTRRNSSHKCAYRM